MPADWALGSLIIAVIALLISREFPMTLLMKTIIATCLRWFCFESALCDSAVWDDLPDAYFHSHQNCASDLPGGELFRKLPYSHRTENFLEYFSNLIACGKKRAVKKPQDLDLMRKYFHTDVKTLLMCFMSTIDDKGAWLFNHDASSNSYTFMFSKFGKPSFLALKRHSNYFEADIHAPCRDCHIVNRRTKTELERIIVSGAPPWYQQILQNKHHVAFRFPEPNDRSMARAGWIVAIGLGDANALPYFGTSFGNFRSLSPSSHHRGPSKGSSYWQGCQYLQGFICDQIGKQFPENELVQVTNQAIRGMLDDHTGSGISRFLNHTPLENAVCSGRYTEGLDASDIEFAINVFNSLYLAESDIQRLRGIMLPVLAGSIRGLHRVLQYLNSRSFQLRGDFNDLVVQNSPVFLGY
jgi:hypothetical protein